MSLKLIGYANGSLVEALEHRMLLSTVTLNAVADARVEEANALENFGSSSLYVGEDGGELRSYVGWDILSQVPVLSTATITNVTLQLRKASSDEPVDMNIARVLSPWDEDQITWSNQPSTQSLTQTFEIPMSSGWLSIYDDADLLGWVRNVASGAVPDYGLALLSVDALNYLSFSSRSTAYDPKLIIEFEIPEVHVQGGAYQIVDGDSTPSTLDGTQFGAIYEGRAPVSRTFTVWNNGSAPLLTSGLALPEGFTVTEALDPTIAPGASDAFTVAMSSDLVGPYAGDVSFNNNDADENPYTFRIAGEVKPLVHENWTISGTSGADVATLAIVGDQYQLTLNGKVSYKEAFLIDSIAFDMLGGDDSVTVGGTFPVTLYGGSGADTLKGGEGADLISGGTENDYIISRGGADSIDAGSGNDTVYSGTDADSIVLGDGNDVVRSGADNDSVWGGRGLDTVIGDNHADVLYGDEDSDTINGGDGNDTIYGGLGSDRLIGVGGNDVMYGGDDRDQLMGGYDNDRLYGESGADTLKGGLGNDSLNGGASSDILLGEAGDDTIDSSGDSVGDVARGDAGFDHLVYDVLDKMLDVFEESVLA